MSEPLDTPEAKLLDAWTRLEQKLATTPAQPVEQRPSAETEARARLAGTSEASGRRFKTLQRFDYWKIPTINPSIWSDIPAHFRAALEVDHAAHAALERQYGDAHRAGDSDAMFEYAQIDAWCFRSAWFVEQLETWRDAGEDGRLRKVMASFARNASKVPNEKLRAEVDRDQKLFERLVRLIPGLSLNECSGQIANEFEVSEDTVRLVYDAYRGYFDQEMTRGVPIDEFFRRLTDMLTRFP